MKKLVLLCLLVGTWSMFAQAQALKSPYQAYFDEAYQTYPNVPKGMLESVAFVNTRIAHVNASEVHEACSGMPHYYGVMGLVEDGKGVFRNNLLRVSELSGYSVSDIKKDPRINILAYAKAYSRLKENKYARISNAPEAQLELVKDLSELTNTKPTDQFAMDAQAYSVLTFLTNPEYAKQFRFPNYKVNLATVFGEANLRVLSSQKITLNGEAVTSIEGNTYQARMAGPCYDVPGVLWVTSPNYSSRSGTAITAVTVHTMQGSYAGSISWFQNTSANASAHYMVRSSDGQITQMVCEADKAWHVGSENPYTIGIEHEGYIDNASWYTTAMYNASASIVRDVVASGYGINGLRTYNGPSCSGSSSTCQLGACVKVKGHQHFPNQSHTDPGPNWNWDLYYNLINNTTTINVQTATSGTIYDSGGSAGNYANDERNIWRIAPTGATTVTLNINSFNVEANWDYLYIYDGSTYAAPLIGRYTGTTIPSTITSTGGALLLDFRTDCATTGVGFSISWTAQTVDVTAPTTAITAITGWKTTDFTANFTDTDNAGGSGIQKALYQVSDYTGTEWRANGSSGFFNDEFSGTAIHSDWTASAGTWSIVSGVLNQTDEANANTNIYAAVAQNLSNMYLYHWTGTISGTGTNKRAGLHFFANAPTNANRGVSYFVYFRDDTDKIQIYEVDNTDAYTMVKEVSYTLATNTAYDYKVFYDRTTGKMEVYINNVLAADWTDTTPISTGTHVSFRSGNCQWKIDNFRVYRSRTTTPTVTVGNSTTKDVRYQSPNSTTPSARLRSIVRDNAGNLSTIVSSDVKIDFWAPTAPTITSTSYSMSSTSTVSITCKWNAAADNQSGVSGYSVKIGSTPGGSDKLALTSVGTALTTTKSISYTTGATYYVTVVAHNNAGLTSVEAISPGLTMTCAKVTGTIENSIASSAVSLGWTAVTGATSYQIYVKNNATAAIKYYTSTTNSVSLGSTAISPSTSYTWKVRALCNTGGYGLYSTTRTFSTPAFNGTPTAKNNTPEQALQATQAPSFVLQPNPAHEYLQINFEDELEQANVQITNAQGQVVRLETVGGNALNIHIADLPSGIYSVSVQSQGSTHTQRFVKQ
jgi:hypothetical protein